MRDIWWHELIRRASKNHPQHYGDAPHQCPTCQKEFHLGDTSTQTHAEALKMQISHACFAQRCSSLSRFDKPWKIFPFGRSTRTRLKQGNTKASHQAQESISLFFADLIHPQRFFSDWCNPCYFTTAISIQFMSRALRLILLCLFKKREVYYHPGLCFVSAWAQK